MNTIIVFVETSSPRLNYIAEFIFQNILNVKYSVTNSLDKFLESDAFKINYSTQHIASHLTIIPFGLLNQTTIIEQAISMDNWNTLPSFFTTSKSEIPFDILSASFYLLSRYEEYLEYTPDIYQRFPVENSLAYKNNFLTLPLIDLWVMEFKKIIQIKNHSFEFPQKKMKYLPTYDIDIAYSYLAKGWKRTVGGLLKDLSSGRLDLIVERVKVLLRMQNDPFDSFNKLDKLHAEYNLKPLYFFLLSERGIYDKNNSRKHGLMRTLITRIQSKYEIGIHPSYGSHDDLDQLKRELSLLNTTKSRQHYIRFLLPTTFDALIENGIKEDYSMGYGSRNGFRASTSFPHFWFNLSENKITSLKLIPFCFMECNSFFEQNYNAEEALNELKYYADIVTLVKGNLVTIWHNFSLGSSKQWKSWDQVYFSFLTYLANN